MNAERLAAQAVVADLIEGFDSVAALPHGRPLGRADRQAAWRRADLELGDMPLQLFDERHDAIIERRTERSSEVQCRV